MSYRSEVRRLRFSRNKSDLPSNESAHPFIYKTTRHSNLPSISSLYYGETESHQYEQDENEVWWHNQRQRYFEDKGRWWTFARKSDFLRWSLTLLTGFLCGLVAWLVTFFTKLLTKSKFQTFYLLLEREKSGSLVFGAAFLYLFTFNVVFGVIAWATVFVEPLAAGSGIPEVKCFLNGLDIPRLMRFRTLMCKAVGIVFSCTSGLPLGKEGPMVHVGAVVAAGVSKGTGVAFAGYQDLSNDREKRDFVSCGAAAGVAAAFGAPIGGVLFSLEEGASFWSTKLTWRCFFCAMTTVFSLYLLDTADSLFGHSDSAAMFSFGEFFSLQGETSNYSVWELALFVLVGCVGGLIGATFNTAVQRLTRWRSAAVVTSGHRLLEVLVIVGVMSSLALLLPLAWGRCTPLPTNMEGWSEQEKALVEQLVPFYCEGETHYNELASLYLTDSDTAIRQLFHFREVGDADDSTFSSGALFLFFVPYITMACLTYGSAVPAGMFVPSLMAGAAFGRLVGHLLHRIDNTSGTFADSGTYALMGASAITSGVTRMTISLTVMVLEATGDMQYVLPLMLTVMAARLVGNIFTEGLYDMHIHDRQLDFLEEDEGASQQASLQDLSVRAIMTRKPVCVAPVMRVGDLLELMQRTSHHCYPVVDDRDGGVLVGAVTRTVVCTLLRLKTFVPADPTSGRDILTDAARKPASRGPADLTPLVSWEKQDCASHSDARQLDVAVAEDERLMWVDLRPYIDCSPYTIGECASAQRTHRMFRTLGLRHLCVIDRHNRVLGVVTRADLVAVHRTSSDDSDFARSIDGTENDDTADGSGNWDNDCSDKHCRPRQESHDNRAALFPT